MLPTKEGECEKYNEMEKKWKKEESMREGKVGRKQKR